MSANYPKAVIAEGTQRLYHIWCKMRERCNNPNADSYPNYGGKGVQVCTDWNHFERFREWALRSGYTSDLTIERRDSTGGYNPVNCTWATRTEQNQNRSTVARNTEGVAWCEVARLNGIGGAVYRNRIALGWKPEDASSVANLGKRAGARTRRPTYLGDDGKVRFQ